MELFLNGLPAQLTDRALERILKPLLDQRRIYDYKCQRLGRGRNATVTFLHAHQGQAFLDEFGDKFVGGRQVRKLQLANIVVSCRKSYNKPDRFLLLSLETREAERLHQTTAAKAPEQAKVDKIPIRDLSCGVYDYGENGQLQYHRQVRWPQHGGDGSLVKFINKTVVIKLANPPRRVEMSYSSIWEIVAMTCEPHDSSTSKGDYNLTFTLVEAPRLYTTRAEANDGKGPIPNNGGNDGPPLARISCLDEKHKDFAGLCLVYQVAVKCDHHLFYKALQSLKARKELAISWHSYLEPSRLYNYRLRLYHFEAFMVKMMKEEGVPFELAFQVQALVQNGYLLPSTTVTLLEEMVKHSKIKTISSRSFCITPQAVRRLLEVIPYPGPAIKASQLSATTLMRKLLSIQSELDDANAQERHRLLLGPDGGPIAPSSSSSAQQPTWHHPSSTMAAAAAAANTNQIAVHRALVTPTRVILQGPEMEAPNRVLRRFSSSEASTTFLRVQFGDEDGGPVRLWARHRTDNAQVFERFESLLNRGMDVPGGATSAGTSGPSRQDGAVQRFSFLGWSTSSLRAHSVWMSTHPYKELIESLGDFSKLRCPARCAARIGQAFSETPTAVPLKKELRDDGGPDVDVKLMKEVTSPDGGRVFSDGVGTISPALARRIYAQLPFSRKRRRRPNPVGRGDDVEEDLVTCFQVRCGAAKGMLSMDSRLNDAGRPDREVVRLRPSMIKFEGADYSYLEICDAAFRPLPMFLNRQMIRILEDMGAPEEWFFSLQERAVDELRQVCNDPRRLARFLQHKDVALSAGLGGFLRRLHKLGLDYVADESGFLPGVIEAVVLRELRLLKHKAHMAVPGGVTLFGVLDETGWLAEGEVYVTFDAPAGRSGRRRGVGAGASSWRPPPAGTLLVITRSPALHPGDVRLVRQAVPPSDLHPLRALRNCVVFSRRGDRDLPSQLSGGDLDGDIYNVIWDDGLCAEERLAVHRPADYERVKPVDLHRPVTREDMTKFFVQFMESDILGVVATRHMVLADQRPAGTRDLQCIKLAELHSNAVDFPKTGAKVDQNEMNIRGFKPWVRPDFLAPSVPTRILDRHQVALELERPVPVDDGDDDDETPDRNSYYESTNLLGKLYRAIDERRIWEKDIQHHGGGRGDGKGKAKAVVGGEGVARKAGLWAKLMPLVEEMCTEYFPGLDVDGRMEDARRIRHCYEDAVIALSRELQTHPIFPLEELEVFTGHIFDRHSGIQTRQQRDRSIKLRGRFDNIARWIVQGEIRGKDSKKAAAKIAAMDTAAGEDVSSAKTPAGASRRIPRASEFDDSDSDSTDPDDDGALLFSADTDTLSAPLEHHPRRGTGAGAVPAHQPPDAAADDVGGLRDALGALRLDARDDAADTPAALLAPERVEALRTAVACLRAGLAPAEDEDDGDSFEGRAGNMVESFKVIAAAVVLRELDAAAEEAESRKARERLRMGFGSVLGGGAGGLGRGGKAQGAGRGGAPGGGGPRIVGWTTRIGSRFDS